MFVNRFFAPDQSATSQLASDLAAFLVREGFEVEALASDQRIDGASSFYREHSEESGVRVTRLSGTRFGRRSVAGRILDYCSFLLCARREIRRRVRPEDVLILMTDPPLLHGLFPEHPRQIHWHQDVFPDTAVAAGIC